MKSIKDNEGLLQNMKETCFVAERRETGNGRANNLVQALEDPSSQQVVKKLYAMTKRELKQCSFRGEKGGAVPGGLEVEDFIQEAIKSGLKATNPWNPERADLYTYLWAIIKNHIRDCLKLLESKRERRGTSNSSEVSANIVDLSQIKDEKELHEELEAAEEQNEILEKLRDDRDIKIIEAIITKGVWTPKEIADALDMNDQKEIYNARKRLRKNKYLCVLFAKYQHKKSSSLNKVTKKKTSSEGKRQMEDERAAS